MDGGAPAAPARLAKRQIAAICAGNALEFYDFVVYAIFAVQIGRAFFPSDRPGLSLLASLATFGVGFATRPLGAFVIGRMADRAGRRPAMLLSFSLIGLSVGGLALTPGYARIGIAAPILAVAFRLLQGFALGGEVGPSTALLLESAPVRRRGLYVSLQAMSADGAVMVAGLVGVLLAATLPPAALDAWGWRLALLAGLSILPFALAARRTLVETLGMEEALPPRDAAHRPRRVVVLGLLMLASATLLGGLFARGAIRGWARPMGGGEPAVLKEPAWEVDDFARRFATSAIDPRRPFDEGAPPTHWIFADAADWAAMIEASVADVATRRPVPRPRAPAAVDTPTSVALDRGDFGGGGYLRMPDVERLTGLSRSTIYRKMEASRFPRSVQLSDNASGWRERDVAEWLADPR